MHEIICPHCGKAFKIDETGYADILKQVRDSEFDKQLHERLELAAQDKRNAVELAQIKVASELQKAAADKDAEIQGLKAKLDAIEVAQKLAITEAISAVEKERDELKGGLERAELEKQLAEKSLKEKYETQIKDRDDAIERLRDMKGFTPVSTDGYERVENFKSCLAVLRRILGLWNRSMYSNTSALAASSVGYFMR